MEVLSNEFTPLNRGDVRMPKVGNKHFPYTPKGKAAAKKAMTKKTPKKKKPTKKSSA
tara:strand:+ start:19 stop:189 length:171 start_codon:yes stop_codon:yes gene_type:complete